MKQLRQCFFVQVGSDHAQAAGVIGAAVAQVDLSGNIVKLEPFSRGILQDALCAEDPAVLFLIGQFCENGTDFILLIALRCFQADVSEDFVGVVFPFAVMMVMVMIMAMLMMVMMLMFPVLMMMFMLFIVIVIIVIVVIVMVMMPVAMLMFCVLMMMLMFIMLIIVIVVVIFQGSEIQGLAVLNDVQHEIGFHVIPRRGDNPGVGMGFGNQ